MATITGSRKVECLLKERLGKMGKEINNPSGKSSKVLKSLL